jgi:hypothetical protein
MTSFLAEIYLRDERGKWRFFAHMPVYGRTDVQAFADAQRTIHGAPETKVRSVIDRRDLEAWQKAEAALKAAA